MLRRLEGAGTAPAFVDSHTHLDLMLEADSGRIGWLRSIGCLPVSWAFGEGIASVSDLKACLARQQLLLDQYVAQGLECYFLTGIHPRCIPSDLRPEQAACLIAPHLEHPCCLGIGEIGLETASSQEMEILQAQLEFGKSALVETQVFGVHTPMRDKLPVAGRLLEMLQPWRDISNRIVIDHCSRQMIGAVLENGFWAGVSLSAAKTSFDELGQMVEDNRENLDRILLNTDSGARVSEDLYRFFCSGLYPDPVRANLVRNNALAFYRLGPTLAKSA